MKYSRVQTPIPHSLCRASARQQAHPATDPPLTCHRTPGKPQGHPDFRGLNLSRVADSPTNLREAAGLSPQKMLTCKIRCIVSGSSETSWGHPQAPDQTPRESPAQRTLHSELKTRASQDSASSSRTSLSRPQEDEQAAGCLTPPHCTHPLTAPRTCCRPSCSSCRDAVSRWFSARSSDTRSTLSGSLSFSLSSAPGSGPLALRSRLHSSSSRLTLSLS